MSLKEKYGASMTEWEAKKEMKEFGIPTVEEKLAKNEEEAVSIAEDIGLPVVLKVESKNVKHKTDAGGVEKAHTEKEVREKFQKILESVKKYREDADIRGVLVEEVLDGEEFIVGVNKDPQFGKVLMFGLGGIYVEVFRDVSFRPLPVSEEDVKDMVEELESKDLLKGVRGRPPADMELLVETVMKIGEFGGKDEVDELDVNPLFVRGENVKVADALVTLEGER